MFKKVTVPPAQRTIPYGEVIINTLEGMHTYIPVEMWNNKRKQWEVVAEREDPDHIVANDLSTIPANCCIECHKEIKHYETKYYEKHMDDGFQYCFERSEKTHYCEECANELSAVAEVTKYAPDLVKTENFFQDGQTLERQIFSDGSVIEDMSIRDLAQKKII